MEIKDEISKGEKLAKAHWDYVAGVLTRTRTDLTVKEINTISWHYRTAFVHGYKHAVEDAMNLIQRDKSHATDSIG